jgi:hypothetical protein
MTGNEAPLFRFSMWAVARRDDPYYYTNWDGKQQITVLARTKQEAINLADAALGGKPGRYHHWTFKIREVTDSRIPGEVQS